MGKNGRLEGQERDTDGLAFIWDYGWLRPQELGLLMWGAVEHATKYGERLARKWLAKGYVLARKLPDHNGTAYVLSQAGAEFLQTVCNIEAKTGKDWGEMVEATWVAPKWWRHDLMANGLLAVLASRGLTVLPERRLRRENPQMKKIPDGLAIHQEGKGIWWLEVESARKTGKSMNDMAKALIRAPAGNAPVLSGHKPTAGMVAFTASARDDRDHAINHQLRTTTAIQRFAPRDTTVTFVELKMVGAGVTNFTAVNHIINADEVSRKAARMAEIGWDADKETGGRTCFFAGLVASYWKVGNEWQHELADNRDERPHHERYTSQEPKILARGKAKTGEECRRKLAAAWSGD